MTINEALFEFWDHKNIVVFTFLLLLGVTVVAAIIKEYTKNE